MSDNRRIAAAPISWGVCEAAEWGVQLSADRVMREMAELGIEATEFGPLGFLPEAPAERAAYLAERGLKPVGGFLPVVLHREDTDPTELIAAELQAFVEAGAEVLVLSADAGTGDYERHYELTEAEWVVFTRRLGAAISQAEAAGILAVLHPHVGTMIESHAAVERLLESTNVKICLDTGHLIVGGTSPVALVRRYPDRIGHVHLKDVDAEIAARVAAGEIGFVEGVKAGMFVPLGEGDSRIAEVVQLLEASGYSGWYVMEQDACLTTEEEGEGAQALVKKSLDFLASM